MPTITLHSKIKAHPKLVFDLTRSIEAHLSSTSQTNEKVVAGKTSGLMELNDTVTWEAKHFGVRQQLSSKITSFNRPTLLADEMVKGAFKSFRHEHHFSNQADYTLITDIFAFTSPLGPLGKIADVLFLKKYMTTFLEKRNSHLKKLAESDQWKTVIPEIFHKEYLGA